MTPRDLLTAFPRPSERAHKPTLVVISGLPASGKSYFARAVATHVPVAHVASDAVRMALTDGRPTYSGEESGATHGTVSRIAGALLAEGYHVMIDSTGIKPRDRRPSLEVAGPRPSILVWCQADEATATARLARRAAGLDPLDRSEATAEIRARMATSATPPSASEARKVVIVTPETFDAGLNTVVRALGGRIREAA